MVPSSANGCIIGETAPQGFLNGRMPCAVFTPRGRRSRDHRRQVSVLHALEAAVGWCPVFAPDGPADHILGLVVRVTRVRRQARMRVPRRIATGETDPDQAEGSLEVLTWAQQLAHHLMGAVHHLREPAPGDEA